MNVAMATCTTDTEDVQRLFSTCASICMHGSASFGVCWSLATIVQLVSGMRSSPDCGKQRLEACDSLSSSARLFVELSAAVLDNVDRDFLLPRL